MKIVINNFNRLSTTKRLIEQLEELGYSDIYIIDNNSTYPPLLSWYKNDYKYSLISLEENIGPRAIYDPKVRKLFIGEEWVTYSDSDIELNKNAPKGFIEELVSIAEEFKYNKVGLALDISDLPNTPEAEHYRNWEAINWRFPLEENRNIYKAAIDTTFCIIKPNLDFQYEAIRVAGNFTARHYPWYINLNDLNEEDRYYIEEANDLSTLKRFYNSNILKTTT